MDLNQRKAESLRGEITILLSSASKLTGSAASHIAEIIRRKEIELEQTELIIQQTSNKSAPAKYYQNY